MDGRRLDVLFINPNSAKKVYQDLADNWTAIENPTWALLLAQSCRSVGFGVAILDCDAEHLSDEDAVERILEINPRLVCFTVYSSNPNGGTTNMVGALSLCNLLKSHYPEYTTCFVGSHTSALPKEVLSYKNIDIVLLNEGVYALRRLLATDFKNDLSLVRGIGWKDDGRLILNEPMYTVPQHLMDKDLPGMAFDLLPKKRNMGDMYRAHLWHADFNYNYRTPAVSLYTSLGCIFGCRFCMINSINRISNDDNISAADSRVMRFWSPEFVLRQFDELVKMGITTIRIADEMFVLNQKYYLPIVKGLAERGYGDILRLWCYSRVNSVKEKHLEDLYKGGVKWIALGVEAASQQIRVEIDKGQYQEVNIRQIAKAIKNSGISTIANYIFGFENDSYETMQETLDLAIELDSEMANMYSLSALPGSPVHLEAKQKGWALPDSFEGYSFHSYECQPLPTNHLTAAQVLKFRDEAWHRWFTRPEYLSLVERKFGLQQRHNVEEMTKIKLKRKILGD